LVFGRLGHKELQQLIVGMSGRFDVIVDDAKGQDAIPKWKSPVRGQRLLA
jgi:hypothetical protein